MDPRGEAGSVQNNPALYGYYGVNGPIAFTMYLGNSGTHGGSQNGQQSGGQFYGSPAPTYDGVLYVDSKVRFEIIKDGTSNTIMVGERPPSQDLNFGWWAAGWGYNGTGTGDVVMGSREIYYAQASWYLQQLNPDGSTTAPNPACTQANVGFRDGSFRNVCDQTHWWSNHPGGANFLMCDGSVRFYSYDIDRTFISGSNTITILMAMQTRNGNEVFSLP
jgi:prepilin-type processing-associated H-X9-DG protein